VWCSDITYIPFKKGFLYLVAIMDWHSRKVLTWRVSNTMTSDFCRGGPPRSPRPLRQSLDLQHGSGLAVHVRSVHPRVARRRRRNLDGRVGRAIDNVFIERLWRTLKYDHVYLNPAESGNACRDGITEFLTYYNEERPHSSLSDATPDEVYYHHVSTNGLPELDDNNQLLNS